MAHAAHLHLRSALPAGPLGHLRDGLTRWPGGLLLLILLLALTACGDLPRPFKAGDKQANPLLVPPEGGELLVQRPTGLVPGLDDGGAALLAEGLTLGGVKASAVGRSAIGADLQVHVDSVPMNRANERLLISWEVISPSGALRGETRQDLVAPVGAWANGDPRVLLAVAQDAAPKLAPLVSGPDPTATSALAAAPTNQPVPLIAVGTIQGAPGDGDQRLGEAIQTLLVQQGFRLMPEPAPNLLLVEGQIKVGISIDDQQKVSLSWIVREGLDGAELGTVTQENLVPAGSLDGAWGQTAVYAAEGAVQGILDVLRRKGRI